MDIILVQWLCYRGRVSEGEGGREGGRDIGERREGYRREEGGRE